MTHPRKTASDDSEDFSDEEISSSLAESDNPDDSVSETESTNNENRSNTENEEDDSEKNAGSSDENEMDSNTDNDDYRMISEEVESDMDSVGSNEEDNSEEDDEDDEENNGNEEDDEEMESDGENDLVKGQGIMAQSKLYNGILTSRMKTQEAVTAMNQLPQGENYKYIESCEDQFKETLSSTKSLILKTLDNLVKLQNELLSSCSDTQFVLNDKSRLENDSENVVQMTEKRNAEDYPEFLSKRQKLLNKYRDDTLEKTGKVVSALPISNTFSNFETSTLAQIQQVLLDKDRLIKRTQLIRTSLPIIGKEEEKEEDFDLKSSRKQKYDVEIFDDSDFFNKLLTQHISLKTAGLTDMTAVSKEWAELSKLRKNKIVVDRKASKGRKTRYTVHRKLVNFMTGVDLVNLYSDEQRDALAREVFRGQC